ncbi:unnamed protein product [Rangifer tarandus platyrhynchus]|uniref:Uncharacterized protein n=2 Tax=Rangifer tarandus platyrhynchus TaxID=3082113 RepID=A0AC59Y6A7_RANTA|nr:unnamed protein product [Rangifer tarandus platyrhynchus]
MSQPLRALVSSSPPLFLYDFSNPLETELMISLKIHRCLKVKSGPLIYDCFMKSLSQNEFQYSLGKNTGAVFFLPTEPQGKPKNAGAGSLSLLQGIFPTQESNQGLLHCGRILHQLSHKGSPGMLERAACPFSRGSSQPRNRTRVSCIVGGFFIN